MFDYADFETHPGEKNNGKIIFLGLSTCSFCKRGMEFMNSHGIGYDFLLMDKIDPELKKRIKTEFAEKFGKRLSYPTLILENGELLTGFIRPAWEQELLEE